MSDDGSTATKRKRVQNQRPIATPKSEPWRSRIVGHGDEDPEQLLANPKNWRTHPKAQRDAVVGLIDQVGWVTSVIVNERTGMVVDGHLRIEEAISRGERVPVTYVDLDEAEEALVLASLDPLAAMAGTDADALQRLMSELEADSDGLRAMLDELAEAHRRDLPEYTQKIVSPIYVPGDDKPAIETLYDEARSRELVEAIDAADVTEAERAFLTAAATRHTVFNYAQIADYYAHSRPEVQRLIEASALVIIDADQAIERGFLKLHEDVLAAFHTDYPDA